MPKAAAIKALSIYAQKNDIKEMARLTYGGGRVAVSGRAGIPEGLKPSTILGWNAMLIRHGFQQMTRLPPDNCAEAHLWLEMINAGESPKNVDIWTVKLNRKGGTKFDSACPNCNQWFYKEFRSFNSN